jgi:predicted nucleic acid-binding protein
MILPVFVDTNVLIYALDARGIADETSVSHWDSLIVASAVHLGCETLLSEDMQHGQVIEGVRIVNPFLENP